MQMYSRYGHKAQQCQGFGEESGVLKRNKESIMYSSAWMESDGAT